MIRAVHRPMGRFCVACFNGEYPFEEKAGGFKADMPLCAVEGKGVAS